MKKFILLLIVLLTGINSFVSAQVTTASLSGRVSDDSDILPGAVITATHTPSGTTYYGTANESGRFLIQGMRTGGPYTLEVSLLGFNKYVQSGINLRLGETFDVQIKLEQDNQMLNEVVITGVSQFNASKTGAASNFNRQQIENMPTVSRSIYDVAKLTPQAVVSGSGLSFAGSNNRYNSFQIDGAVNNDVFGLASSGTNGGQSGANPISLDAIEEIQVVIAPFDVRQSGFTGGGINAITKSGTNTVHGSLYGYFNNQDLVGKTAGKDIENRTKLTNQSEKTYGFTIGGPIVKDKLFFFANAEKVEKTYPSSYNVGAGSNITKEQADQVINKLTSLTGGYNGGGYGQQDINTEATKLLARIDWNINKAHKATVRYSYVEASQLNFSNSANALRLNDNGYNMNNKTNSFVGELNSRLSQEWFNEFRVGYTRVRDFREITGQPLPYIKINLENARSIELGTERYTPANSLDQDVWTLTNNTTWYKGNHTITFGTHNEFFKMKNLFIRDNFGSYIYDSMDDFLSVGTANEKAPYEYNYSFSREDITGSKNWAPSFGAAQLGFYGQDDWAVTDRFNLTYGLRVDIPVFLDKPGKNEAFNASAIAQEYQVATDQMPKTQIMMSPRVGFRWNIDEKKNTLLRGGLGIFTGRVPFVWISNSFSNTGVEYSRTRLQKADMAAAMADGFKFQIDPSKQFTPSSAMTSEIDVVDKKFKFPQVFRVNLAVDQNFGNGFRGSIEGLYSKTMNNIMYKNLVVQESGKYLNNGGDQRLLYTNRINPATNQAYTKEYTGIVYLTNTSEGYTYSVTGKLEKDFDFGLNTMVAYTFGRSKGINDGTSSQAFSNWSYNENWQGPNNPELSYSDFDTPHRIIGTISYRKEYAKNFATSVSLFYNGQSGANYSVTYKNNINNDGVSGNDVLYIPTDTELANMKFQDITNSNKVVTSTADQQRTALGEWINNTKDIREKKGQYVERNGLRTPFEHHFDFHIAQDFYLNVSGRRHTLQVNFDILNVGNLLNSAWGLYNSPGYSYSPVTVASVSTEGVPTFQFTKPAGEKLYNISDYNSRWRSQIGVKYIF
ncbi:MULTISPECIES: carboxypeptidase regulatory-like domain-containing protein [unclassified Dysgonomonas]|uniref:TonB-dependent receptor n=1 Tax=unclassified Dysgonomonas TaxID=2630389 RepID=UPI000680574B|nr:MULTISPECIES: carboxypeptidase regulatory-like domain-containing protein [unclassified Dysgonomonas]MBD8346854.1 TonB-dependent receptor [Dysgonomonas sp. HGC4]MBF0575483.1 TonB-dependent receptor [Dysgonomonas sp. GY617]